MSHIGKCSLNARLIAPFRYVAFAIGYVDVGVVDVVVAADGVDVAYGFVVAADVDVVVVVVVVVGGGGGVVAGGVVVNGYPYLTSRFWMQISLFNRF